MDENARSLAIFIDFENLALGFQGRDRFDMGRVLERLVEKGKIVAKRAYADWSRFSNYTFMLHNAAIELVEIPRRALTGKNSADIRLCVDAMDLAYSKEHIDTFVVVSGDSDFSPLVSKLKELGKHVIGLGMIKSTSDLLRDNCDEFIYYEDLGKTQELSPQIDPQIPEGKRKAFSLLMDALAALRRDNQGNLGSSTIKDTIKRKKPSFNESYHGYRSFSDLLLDAQKQGLVELDVDKRSRTYVVARFGEEMALPKPESRAEREAPEEEGELPVLGQRRSRRRRRRGNGNGNGNGNRENEAGRVRMSVPLPSGTNPLPLAPVENNLDEEDDEEDDDDLDILEETDPRLSRLDDLDVDEDEEEERPAPQVRPQPQPQPQPRPQPQPQQKPQVHQPRPQQQQPQRPQPQPQQKPQQQPAPRPQQQQPQRPQPQPTRPAPTPNPTPRAVVPVQAQPTDDDDDLFFSSTDKPRPAVVPVQVTPQPQPTPTPQPTQRPRSQPVPKIVEEPVPEEPEVEEEAVEKKPAKKRAPRSRAKKKPAETPAPVEPTAE